MTADRPSASAARPAAPLQAVMRALIAATPPPVLADDPTHLIEQAQAIADVRAPLLVELTRLFDGGAGTAGCEELLASLADLDRRWQAALACTRTKLSERLQAAQRLRRVER